MALMYCRECGKQVSSEARSCPHCGVPSPVYTGELLPQHMYYQHPAPSAHNNGLAAVLSVFFPGLGQVYKGRVGAGIGWFFATIIGYMMLVIPGLIVHACCVFNAANNDR